MTSSCRQELLVLSTETNQPPKMTSSKNQYFAVICANLLSITYGVFCGKYFYYIIKHKVSLINSKNNLIGWPSPSLPLLLQEDSVLLDTPLSNNVSELNI